MRHWKIVPVEPTPEMLEAGTWMEYGESSFTMQWADEDSVREVWDCMLTAAPGVEPSAHAAEVCLVFGRQDAALTDAGYALPLGTRLYAHPAPVGLTDDMLDAAWDSLIASGAHPHEFPSREQVREALCYALTVIIGKR